MKRKLVCLIVAALTLCSLTACNTESILEDTKSYVESDKFVEDMNTLKDKAGEAKDYLESEEFEQKAGEAMEDLKENSETVKEILDTANKQLEKVE